MCCECGSTSHSRTTNKKCSLYNNVIIPIISNLFLFTNIVPNYYELMVLNKFIFILIATPLNLTEHTLFNSPPSINNNSLLHIVPEIDILPVIISHPIPIALTVTKKIKLCKCGSNKHERTNAGTCILNRANIHKLTESELALILDAHKQRIFKKRSDRPTHVKFFEIAKKVYIFLI